MITIGLTGGSGSGKSTVAKLLMTYGVKWIDTDCVYHDLISAPSPCTAALSLEFGTNILADDGSVNRRALAKIVFAKTPEGQNALAALNRITHVFVREECEKRLQEYRAQGASIVVLDVPLLFESGFDKMCDITVAVLAPHDTRVQRIILRDGIDCEAAKKRIAAQKMDRYYEERATYTLMNDGDEAKLQKKVEQLAQKISLLF